MLASFTDVIRGEPVSHAGTFERDIKPLLQTYCVRCHGPTKAEANIRLDDIDGDIVNGEHFDRWEDIREAFNSGEMPPEDQKQPSGKERSLITHWLDTEFKKVIAHGVAKKRGRVRRLTRYELQYALKDLLHVDAGKDILALPEEGKSVRTGLKNSGRMLMMSGPHLESYLNVILSVTNRMKKIVAFEPYSERLDIETLDTNPPQKYTRDKKKIKPIVSHVERSGQGIVIQPSGYVDLEIPAISKYRFETSVVAKAKLGGKLQVEIGFTRSDVDPRQNIAKLGVLEIAPSDELRSYTLTSFPDALPRQMTRALDRPFFIRIINQSKNDIYLVGLEYSGNVNGDLTATLIPADIVEADMDVYVRQKISKFIEKAFRRSPSRGVVERYHEVFLRQSINEDAIIALLDTYKEILCSPNFFYVGLPREGHQEFVTAERLALFLWCSVPDKPLLQAAIDGELNSPTVLEFQVERMLQDEKSRRWVEQFTDQWLQTSKLFNVAVDNNYYPRFQESLKDLMLQETVESINDVFRNGASALDLLSAEHVFVNQALAAHYDIKDVRGVAFQKVPVDRNVNRGGLITQGTFLVGNSDGMNSHAILRGVWLSEVILNDSPPDPPKNVPPLDESIPGFEKMTLNEKLFAHRDKAACKGCHQKIDPWGIPFENYDASGAWREKVLVLSKVAERSKASSGRKRRNNNSLDRSFVAIDRKATLPDQVAIDGVQELKDYLVSQRKRDFSEGLVEKILAYALARDIEYHDQELMLQMTNRFETSGYSVPLLVRDIVQSEQFRSE